MEEGPTSYDDMLTNMVADTLCDAPDDHHCKFVLVVECDQCLEARSSLDIATESARNRVRALPLVLGLCRECCS